MLLTCRSGIISVLIFIFKNINCIILTLVGLASCTYLAIKDNIYRLKLCILLGHLIQLEESWKAFGHKICTLV